MTILKDGTNPIEARELINLSEEASRDIIEEILLQRQIRAAENGELEIKIELTNSIELLFMKPAKTELSLKIKTQQMLILKQIKSFFKG